MNSLKWKVTEIITLKKCDFCYIALKTKNERTYFCVNVSWRKWKKAGGYLNFFCWCCEAEVKRHLAASYYSRPACLLTFQEQTDICCLRMYFSVLSCGPFKFVVLFSTCLLRCAMWDSFATAKTPMGKPAAEQQEVLAYEHLFGNYTNNDCGSRQLNLMLQRFILFITQLWSAALTRTDTMSPHVLPIGWPRL